MYDKKVAQLSRYKDDHCRNSSRILHSFVHRKGKTLPIPITSVDVPIKLSRKRKVITRPWPVLLLSDWIRTCCEDLQFGGFFFLGGLKLDMWEDVEHMLSTFWTRHLKIEPDSQPRFPSQCIPIMLHGDEGRGQGKRPILVISYQAIIPWAGPDVVNSEKYFGVLLRDFSFWLMLNV